MIEALFLVLTVIYFLVLLFFYVGIKKVENQPQTTNNWKPRVSVLIAARDESSTIISTLESISKQTYPNNKLEVIVIDDQSVDNTSEVVEQFINEKKLQHFKLLKHSSDGRKPTYKKSAITYALDFAQGEIIMTTDADCKVGPQWIESMVNQYDDQTGMVAGIIVYNYDNEKSLFRNLQALEFSGLVFTGVGCVGMNYPIICNGSNLSYRRKAFDDVGGFKGHSHLPSGDDDLLMQNLHSKTRWKIKYNLNEESINFTRPSESISEFLQQRSRWASKSTHYPGFKTILMLLFFYIFYIFLFISIPLAILNLFSLKILFLGFLLKVIADYLIVSKALFHIKRKDLISYIWIAEIFQIPYILIAGFRGFFNLFKWK